MINILTKEWRPATQKEIDSTRMKGYLSFYEQEIGPNVDTATTYYYLNSKGNKVNCNMVFSRNDDIIVKNENGCQLLIHKTKLFKHE